MSLYEWNGALRESIDRSIHRRQRSHDVRWRMLLRDVRLSRNRTLSVNNLDEINPEVDNELHEIFNSAIKESYLTDYKQLPHVYTHIL